MNIKKICNEYRSMLDRYGFSPETVYYYPIELEKFLNFAKSSGKKKIEEINEVDYIMYRNKLENNGISKKMVIKKMSAIKTWVRLNYEVNPTDEFFSNLYNKISGIKLTISKRKAGGGYKAMPLEHFIEILKTASKMDLETKLFIYLLFTTGGRSQFYGLKLGNIDLEEKLIKVKVKGEKYIEVPIVDKVAELIVEHIKRKYVKDYVVLKKKIDDDFEIVKDIINMHKNEFLFKNGKEVYSDRLKWDRIKKNRRANTKNAERILRRVCESAGLWICEHCGNAGASKDRNTKCDVCGKKVKFVYYTPHQVRKSLATHGYKLGLSLEGTSDLLGHSQMSITKRYYRGKQIDKVREELTGIEKVIEEIEIGGEQ